MIISAINRIITNSKTKAIFSRRFIDPASFYLVDTTDKSTSCFNIENADYVNTVKISNDHFVCVHYFQGEKIVLTIHSFNDPAVKLSRLEIKYSSTTFDGNLDLWSQVPRFFYGVLKDNKNVWTDSIIEIDSLKKMVYFHSLDWYKPSDDMWGIIEVVEVPATDLLILPINKLSFPILYDVFKKKPVGNIRLASRGCACPSFQFRRQKSELWVIDYDTLIRLEVGSWKIIQKRKLTGNLFRMLPLGLFSFTPDEKFCAVARPHNKDILLLEAENMKQVGSIKSKYSPEEVAVFDNFECLNLDLKNKDIDFQAFSMSKN